MEEREVVKEWVWVFFFDAVRAAEKEGSQRLGLAGYGLLSGASRAMTANKVRRDPPKWHTVAC